MITSSDVLKILNDNRAMFTLFAPVNEAFETGDAVIDMSDTDATKEISLYHIVFSTQVRTRDIYCDSVIPPLTMANEETVDVGCRDDDITIAGDRFLSVIIEPDLQTCNGIMHHVDSVLLPSMEENVVGEDIDVDEDSAGENVDENVVGEDIDVDEDSAGNNLDENVVGEDINVDEDSNLDEGTPDDASSTDGDCQSIGMCDDLR